MAGVPMAVPAWLAGIVASLSEQAKAAVEHVMDGLAGEPPEVVIPAVKEAVEEVCAVACEDAAQTAAEWYDALRTEELGAALGAQAYAARDPDATAKALSGIAQQLVDGDEEGWRRDVLERVGYEVRRASNTTVARNGRSEGGLKYARVPTGAETCDYCKTLASRGYVYSSASAALSHTHDHCDCVAMPLFVADARVEGYDPQAIADELGDKRDKMLAKLSHKS